MEKSQEMEDTVAKFLKNKAKSKEGRNLMDRISTIPAGSELVWGFHPITKERSPFPVVKVENVIAFPGVPHFCQKAFNHIQGQLFPSSEIAPLFSDCVFTTRDEFNFFKTKSTFESESVDMGKAAVEKIRTLLEGDMVHYDEEAWLSTVDKYEAFRARQSDQGFLRRLDEAQKIVKKIVDKYPLNEIALSFNGGKDCTVLLQLLRIETRGSDTLLRLQALLVSSPPDAVRIFVCRSVANAFAHPAGCTMILKDMGALLPLVAASFNTPKAPLQLAAASALANWSCLLLRHSATITELGPREEVLRIIIKELEPVTSFGDKSEPAMIRMLQAIVTLMWGDRQVISLGKSRNIMAIVNRLKDAVVQDVGKHVARDIVEMTFAV